MAAPHSTDLAILFADISGSTRLYEQLGNELARETVSRSIDTIIAVVKANDGTVIKTIGDEVMCTFPTAEDAVVAACEMQERIDETGIVHTPKGAVPIAIRVGLHFGEAIHENGDVFGDAVNVAARMASQAKARQIITTKETVDLLNPSLQESTRFVDRAQIKGKAATIDIHEVIWQEEDVTRMTTGAFSPQPQPQAQLRLTYRGTNLILNDSRTSAVLGRSQTADIAVDESLASRQHVRIEQRRGKFFIIDQSTNGTYVHDQKTEAFLRREEMPLVGSGRISLGRSFSESPQEVVHYHSELAT
jgi:class 3 adenylate cyclase